MLSTQDKIGGKPVHEAEFSGLVGIMENIRLYEVDSI